MKERFYLRAKLQAVSPLAVGSGQSEYTDRDILLDSDGKPFLPGSALAGVCRHYLAETGYDTDSLFGKIGKNGNSDADRESRIRFYDAFLTGGFSRSFRDGVRIGSDRTAEDTGKFDYEIADFSGEDEENTYFDFRISVDDVTRDDIAAVNRMLAAMADGYIRAGHKTSRGFGRLKPCGVRSVTVSKVDALLEFDWDAMPAHERQESGKTDADFRESYEFAVTSFLSVSDSATLVCRADKNFIASEPLKNAKDAKTENGITHYTTPIIPGTSWAGVFRHHFRRILLESGVMREAETDEFLDRVFGSTKQASKLVFEESVLSGHTLMQQTRNAVDRFTGGAGDKKLYTNELSFGGKLTLTVSLRKGLEEDEIGLVRNLTDVTVKDFEDGSLSIGGFGAVGGGILRKAEE